MINFANLKAHLKRVLFYQYRFASIGKRTLIIQPLKIEFPKSIAIGSGTYIGNYGWLMGNNSYNVSLKIGDDVQIGHFVHLIATNNLKIENEVLIADKVFISDCTHNYKNPYISIQKQEVTFLRPVCIGQGSWVGENVCIFGASIGKHCVIGANSVVTKDIPDYCVAVGAPAKVIKKYNLIKKRWEKIY